MAASTGGEGMTSACDVRRTLRMTPSSSITDWVADWTSASARSATCGARVALIRATLTWTLTTAR